MFFICLGPVHEQHPLNHLTDIHRNHLFLIHSLPPDAEAQQITDQDAEALNSFFTSRFTEVGSVDIDWVYNSLPPCHGQIYPEIPLTPVVEF